jgi:hypothetical protein
MRRVGQLGVHDGKLLLGSVKPAGSTGRRRNMLCQLGGMTPDIRNSRAFQEDTAHDRAKRPKAWRYAAVLRDDTKIV